MTTDPIRSWSSFACEKNEVPELADKIVVQWNRRFTRRLGDAIYSRKKKRGRIRLSVPLWSRCTGDDKRETVIHETCHVIVGYKNCDSTKRVKPHGPEWRAAMIRCGLKPVVYHTIDREGIGYFLVRDCPNTLNGKCRVGRRDFFRLQRGLFLHCTLCGLRVDRHQVNDSEPA